MAQRSILPLAGALNDIGLVKTNLVNAVISLFKSDLVPDNTTTKVQLEANECDFDDYTTLTIAAWQGPYLATVPGYAINAPVQEWIVVTNVVVNQVGGYWIETAGGVLHDIVVFDVPVPMVSVGQPVVVVPQEIVVAQ